MNLEDLRASDLETLRESLGEKAVLGRDQHPDPGRILICLEGECPEEEAEAIHEHLALCSRCSTLALTLGSAKDEAIGERAFDDAVEEALGDRPRESDWRAVAARIDASTVRPGPRALPRRAPRWFPALAAALLLVTVGSLLRTMQLQSALESRSGLRPGVQSLDLVPREDAFLDGEGAGVVSQQGSAGDLAIYLHLPTQAPDGRYDLELHPLDDPEQTLWRAAGLEPGEDRTLFLAMDRAFLPAGRYRFELSIAGQPGRVGSYDLEVEAEGAGQ